MHAGCWPPSSADLFFWNYFVLAASSCPISLSILILFALHLVPRVRRGTGNQTLTHGIPSETGCSFILWVSAMIRPPLLLKFLLSVAKCFGHSSPHLHLNFLTLSPLPVNCRSHCCMLHWTSFSTHQIDKRGLYNLKHSRADAHGWFIPPF